MMKMPRMPSRRGRNWGLATVLAVMVGGLVGMPAGEARGESEWRTLFDGQSLSGWRGQPDLWSIEDGEIVGRSDGKIQRNEFLATVETFRNFELRLKVRLVGNRGNSGIQFRSDYNDGAVRGYQADVGEGFWGLLYEERGRGTLQKPATEKLKVHRDGWNQYEILAQGDHLRIRVNGQVTVDIRDSAAAEGIVAFQVHLGPPMEVRFTDIRIKVLD